MRPFIFISLLSVAVMSCNQRRTESNEKFPAKFVESEPEKVEFEGLVPTIDGNLVQLNLSLTQSPIGIQARYDWWGLYHPKRKGLGTVFSGNYETRHDGPDFTVHLEIPESRRDEIGDELILTYNTTLDKLTFTFENKQYDLFKRSALFTSEGYATLYQDSLFEFFEKNTREKCDVAMHTGMYNKLKELYLAKNREPHEGMYVRGLCYWINIPNEDQTDRRFLVFKNIVASE